VTRRYDLVVLGAGTAGIVASTYAAGLGARVALAEQSVPGGDCLFTGCIPSKSLLAAANLAEGMRRADRVGLEPVEPRVDLRLVMEHVRSAIDAAGRPDTPAALEARGIDVIQARGRFTGPGRLDVGGRELRWRAAVLATGSPPRLPNVPGLAEANPLTTETVWELEDLPQRLAILGGGPSGVELGQAFARLGSEVTIVETEPRLLPALDAEAAALVAVALERDGVALRAGTTVAGVEAGQLRVAERDETISFDRLLVTGGRRASTAGLGLESVGVELDERGFVKADRRLRTTGNHIWAAGDVLGGLQFTHVAGHQGAAAALNALLRARRSYSPTAVPRVVFCDPEVVAVGLGEHDARSELGSAPVVLRHDYAEADRAITEGRAYGFAKLVCDRRGRLMGAVVAAPHAGEVAGTLSRLVRERARVSDLAETVHAYPTYAEGPARAAESWFWRSYLTPRNRRALRPLLAALRALDRPR
jgi:pyruvate/2-oxoglutarate dehydrogenase complex dihydrolipoamide dehydrogenase (E3) component